MTRERWTLGTRGSQLATTQSGLMLELVRARVGVDVDMVTIRTEGDRLQTEAPSPDMKLDKGLFTSALEEALARGDIDLAVHSLKDVPTAIADGLVLAAIPVREDPRDAFLSDGRRFDELPAGARVATGSPRRARQLTELRSDISVVPVRGNVDTRIRKLRDGEFDGMVLALSGLRRLGRDGEVVEVFAATRVLPAPGQGALAIEMRAGDAAERVRAAIDDGPTRACVTAERAVLTGIGGGCNLPLGAYAQVDGDRLRIDAVLYRDAGAPARVSLIGDPGEPGALGADAARRLLA